MQHDAFHSKASMLTSIFAGYVDDAEARRLGLIWETNSLVYIGVDHSYVIGA